MKIHLWLNGKEISDESHRICLYWNMSEQRDVTA